MGRQVMSQMGEANSTKLKGLSKARQPNDLGLFPRTFIQSPWHKYLPLLTTDPKLWLRIQWMILKKPFVNNFRYVFLRRSPCPLAFRFANNPNSLIYNLFWTRRSRFRVLSHAPFNKKPIPLHLTTRIRDALMLHKQLYTAMATGDRKWLRDNCCSGLADKTSNRIDRRTVPKAGSRPVAEQWELVSYQGMLPGSWVPVWPLCSLLPGTSYKLMNDVVGQIPTAPDTLLRQVVVRIKSKQRYNLNDGKGEQTKTLTEYIVLQKLISQGDDADWRVWGTVNPTTVKEIKAILENDSAEGTLTDRLKALMPTNMGGGPMV